MLFSKAGLNSQFGFQVVHENANIFGYSSLLASIRISLLEGSVNGQNFAFKHALNIQGCRFCQVGVGVSIKFTKRGLFIEPK